MVESFLLYGCERPGEAVGWLLVVRGSDEAGGDLVVELGMEMGVSRACCGLVGVELDGGGNLENRGWRRIAMMERHCRGTHAHIFVINVLPN